MFGDQQPLARQVAADLVGQHLPHAAFQIQRMAGKGFGPLAADTDFKSRGRILAWPTGVEFFLHGNDSFHAADADHEARLLVTHLSLHFPITCRFLGFPDLPFAELPACHLPSLLELPTTQRLRIQAGILPGRCYHGKTVPVPAVIRRPNSGWTCRLHADYDMAAIG